MDFSNSTNTVSGTKKATYMYEPLELHWLILGGIAMSALLLTNLGGNFLTMLSFCLDKKLRIVSNMYIINLAVNDILVGVVSIPLYGTSSLLNHYWPFGYPMCKFYIMVDFIACAGSSTSIMLISYDRYLLVTEGINYSVKQTKRKAGIKIGITWAVILPIYGTFTLFYDTFRGYSIAVAGDCNEEFANDEIFNIFLSTFEFLIPLIFITFLNFRVYHNIHKRTKAKVGPMEKTKEISTISGSGSMQPKEENASHVRLLKRDRRAARSLAALVIIYFVCWAPYTIFTVLISLNDQYWNEDDYFMPYESVIWLLWLNSSLNPIMYALTVPAFKRSYKRILCKLWRGKGYNARRDSVGESVC
ncbi:histamine H3 receptor-like [Lineus longissimus]|uniref:histamine H3 receptor-like n=1 Tax=Lineus longissimus TaxID=88925 RepID=UPI00315C9A49